eukprot:scaffold45251_cov36-Phaeocystis_antarctica.AAC.1
MKTEVLRDCTYPCGSAVVGKGVSPFVEQLVDPPRFCCHQCGQMKHQLWGRPVASGPAPMVNNLKNLDRIQMRRPTPLALGTTFLISDFSTLCWFLITPAQCPTELVVCFTP